MFLSVRLKLLFTFHYEIPCSDGNEKTDSGEYVTESHSDILKAVTENSDKYEDDDDTIDIGEYEGYSDGNEGCEVFT